ncbi:MAG: YraN family protein, partial [Pirellulaceae bacterium]
MYCVDPSMHQEIVSLIATRKTLILATRSPHDEFPEASYRSWVGEIDLVMLDHRPLVFVEVKTWRAAEAGEGPADSVDQRKQ